MLDKDVADSLLSEVPSEVFDAIKPLSDRNNQAIFIALLKNEKMRFGELKTLFKTTYSEDINHPLKSLIKAGVVSKKLGSLMDIGEPDVGIYQPSYLGKSVMRSLYKGVMLGMRITPMTLPAPSNIAVSGTPMAIASFWSMTRPNVGMAFQISSLGFPIRSLAGSDEHLQGCGKISQRETSPYGGLSGFPGVSPYDYLKIEGMDIK